jgi:uncharacterized membrane protein YdjX (TVP38/TMEM64 family)
MEAFGQHPRWEVVRRALLEESRFKTLWIVFLLRLSPVLPFGTTNVLLATTGVRFDLYVLGTLLGLMPRTGLVALAAAGAEKLDFDAAESWWLLLGGLAATAVGITAMAIIGRRALHRATAVSVPDRVSGHETQRSPTDAGHPADGSADRGDTRQ